jgi:hypothetical protein
LSSAVKDPMSRLPAKKCTYAIDRLNKVTSTAQSINQTMFVDSDFTPDISSIMWPDYASPKI